MFILITIVLDEISPMNNHYIKCHDECIWLLRTDRSWYEFELMISAVLKVVEYGVESSSVHSCGDVIYGG